MGVNYFKKYSGGYLSAHMKKSEFQCGCNHPDCGLQQMMWQLNHAFEMTRSEYGAPITITSGYRCQRHNKESKGVPFSLHRVGAAIDLWTLRLDILEKAARHHFDRVIRYENYIHCSMDLKEFPEEDFISWQYD